MLDTIFKVVMVGSCILLAGTWVWLYFRLFRQPKLAAEMVPELPTDPKLKEMQEAARRVAGAIEEVCGREKWSVRRYLESAPMSEMVSYVRPYFNNLSELEMACLIREVQNRPELYLKPEPPRVLSRTERFEQIIGAVLWVLARASVFGLELLGMWVLLSFVLDKIDRLSRDPAGQRTLIIILAVPTVLAVGLALGEGVRWFFRDRHAGEGRGIFGRG